MLGRHCSNSEIVELHYCLVYGGYPKTMKKKARLLFSIIYREILANCYIFLYVRDIMRLHRYWLYDRLIILNQPAAQNSPRAPNIVQCTGRTVSNTDWTAGRVRTLCLTMMIASGSQIRWQSNFKVVIKFATIDNSHLFFWLSRWMQLSLIYHKWYEFLLAVARAMKDSGERRWVH